MKKLVLLMIMLWICLDVGFAFGKPRNKEILEEAQGYSDGSYGNTCKIFVQNVMAGVDGELGAGYRDCYLDAGLEIQPDEVLPGDIIQTSNDDDSDSFYTGCHSAIVSSVNNDGTYGVVHSNWCGTNSVCSSTNYNPGQYANNNSDDDVTISVHFYRLGTIAGEYSSSYEYNENTQLFYSVFNEYENEIGYAKNNGGGVFVHEWKSSTDPSYSVWIQDFYNPDTEEWSSLVLNDLDPSKYIFD